LDGSLGTYFGDPETLAFLEERLEPGMVTGETGAGYSTVIFSARQCHHTCITPQQEEIDRIIAYCEMRAYSLTHTRFVCGSSLESLPGLQQELDVFLVDGAHRFPFPIVDWAYGARLLKPGGLLVLDDINIVSCYIVHRFMLGDSHWTTAWQGRTASAFEKSPGESVRRSRVLDYPNDWMGQSFSQGLIEDVPSLLLAFGLDASLTKRDADETEDAP
jgi:hypothetical protein